MQMRSSARAVWSAPASGSEYTATVRMPISRQARMLRTATSPRLAIKIFENMSYLGATAKENSAATQSFPCTKPFPEAQ